MKLDPKDIVIIATLIGTIVTQVSTCRQKEIEMEALRLKADRLEKSIDSTDRNVSENFGEILKALEK